MAEKLTFKYFVFHYWCSSVIRQKGASENGCFRKIKHAKCSEKQTFLTPWYAHVRSFRENEARQIFQKNNISYPWYAHVRAFQENKARQIFGVSGGKKSSFFGKFAVLCFLETLVLRFALFEICLLPYYGRIIITFRHPYWDNDTSTINT